MKPATLEPTFHDHDRERARARFAREAARACGPRGYPHVVSTWRHTPSYVSLYARGKTF